MRYAVLVTTFLFLVAAAGCAGTSGSTPPGSVSPAATPAPSGPAIAVQGAWARPAAAGQNSAAYFVIENQSTQPDALVGAMVEASVAKMAEVHETKMEGGVMKMSPAPRVEVPAGGKVEFKPGGYHVMLMELQRELKEGDTVTITLTFEKAGKVTVRATVKSQG